MRRRWRSWLHGKHGFGGPGSSSGQPSDWPSRTPGRSRASPTPAGRSCSIAASVVVQTRSRVLGPTGGYLPPLTGPEARPSDRNPSGTEPPLRVRARNRAIERLLASRCRREARSGQRVRETGPSSAFSHPRADAGPRGPESGRTRGRRGRREARQVSAPAPPVPQPPRPPRRPRRGRPPGRSGWRLRWSGVPGRPHRGSAHASADHHRG